MVSVGDLCEVADGVAFVPTFANCSAFDTGDGLFLVDTASSFTAAALFAQLRGWRGARLHTAVFSHGHIDHVFGVGPFEEEAAAAGWPAPRVVAHEHVARRFDRYVLTAGYNQVINRRQFGIDTIVWPTTYRYPDETYSTALAFEVGDLEVELRHEMGETDDAHGHLAPGAGACSARATCSSGPPPTPATPRRSSATRASGRPRCGAWPLSTPRSSCPATACRSSARTASARRSPRRPSTSSPWSTRRSP